MIFWATRRRRLPFESNENNQCLFSNRYIRHLHSKGHRQIHPEPLCELSNRNRCFRQGLWRHRPAVHWLLVDAVCHLRNNHGSIRLAAAVLPQTHPTEGTRSQQVSFLFGDNGAFRDLFSVRLAPAVVPNKTYPEEGTTKQPIVSSLLFLQTPKAGVPRAEIYHLYLHNCVWGLPFGANWTAEIILSVLRPKSQ